MKKFITSIIALALATVGLTAAWATMSKPSGVDISSASIPPYSVDAASVLVSFSKITGAIKYYAKATTGGITTQTLPVSCNASPCQINIDSLSGGSSYSISVTAVDNVGTQVESDPVTFVAKSVPEKPTITSATAGVGQVALIWGAPTNTGGLPLTGYKISVGGVDTTISDPAATSKTFSGLAPGSTLNYTIVAINSLGSSASASFATAVVPSKPSAPTAPTFSASGTTLTATWSAPADNGSTITSYTVSVVNSTNAAGNASKSVTGGTTTTFTGVIAGTYTATVTATNNVDTSDASPASASATVSAASLTANTVTWTPTTLANMTVGSNQTVSASVASGGVVTITVTSNPANACTYDSAVGIIANAVGTCTVTATSPATSTYDAATANKTFNITKATPAITFSAIADKNLPGPFTVSATIAVSGITINFTASGNCSVTQNTSGTASINLSATGSCTVTATSVATSSYASTSVSRTFTILAALGGGAPAPAPAPVVTESPTPTPSPSTTPSPVMTPVIRNSPTPFANPSPEPTGIVLPVVPSATPQPLPSPSKPIRSALPKSAGATVLPSTTKPSVSVSATKPTTAVSISSSKTFALNLPAVAKGSKVIVTLKGADGKSYQVYATTTQSKGNVTLPALKFAKPGTYKLTIKVGNTTKTVTVTVKK